MARYRCYFVDKNGHIRAAENIEAENLDDAVIEGRRLQAERGEALSLEVWQGAARLFPAKDPRPGF